MTEGKENAKCQECGATSDQKVLLSVRQGQQAELGVRPLPADADPRRPLKYFPGPGCRSHRRRRVAKKL